MHNYFRQEKVHKLKLRGLEALQWCGVIACEAMRVEKFALSDKNSVETQEKLTHWAQSPCNLNGF